MNQRDTVGQRDTVAFSPYALYLREEWARLRADTPMPLSEAELENLSGLTEKISTEEVVEIYLPLSRLLNFYVEGAQRLHSATEGFLRKGDGKMPFGLSLWGPDYPDPADYLVFLPGELVGTRVGWPAGSDPQLQKMLTTVRVATNEAVRTRLKEYREKTRPILDLLRAKELIVSVDGTPAPDVVQAELRRKLGLGSDAPGAGELKPLAEVTP